MARTHIRVDEPESETPLLDRERELELCGGGRSPEEKEPAPPERELAGLVAMTLVLIGLQALCLQDLCGLYGSEFRLWPASVIAAMASFAVATILMGLVQWGRVLRAAQLIDDGFFIEGWSDDSRLWPHRRKVRFRNALRSLGHDVTRGGATRRLVGSILMAAAWAVMVALMHYSKMATPVELFIPALNILTGIGFAEEAHLDLLDCDSPQAL